MSIRRSRFAVVPATVFLALLATGCAAPGGVARVPDDEQFACDLAPRALAKRLNLQDRYGQAQLNNTTPTVNMLLLSGGGARGAWGAGYLKGWQSPKDDANGVAMPPFDVVTGVSTGALQATFAFVGDFHRIYEIYTTTTSEKVWKKRFALSIPFSNSVLKSSPLLEELRTQVDHHLLVKVNKQAKNRLLCVGAVSLETGKFREWDLTAIAAAYINAGQNTEEGEELLNLYQTVLLASAAIPVAFPPVEITDSQGRALYVDGGTRENVFVTFGQLLDFALATEVQTYGFDASKGLRIADFVTFNAFVIVNGQLGIAPASVDNHVIPIALRSLDALTSESMNGAIYHIEHELRQRDAKDLVKTRYTYIPGNLCLENSSLEFDPEAMRRQANLAAKYGSALKWFKFEPDASLAVCEKNE